MPPTGTPQEAKVRITLDPAAAAAILAGIQAKVDALQKQEEAAKGIAADLKEAAKQGAGTKDAKAREDRGLAKKAQGLDQRTGLPVSTLDPVKIGLSAIGMIPVAGPAMKGAAEIGLDTSDYGPIATALLEGLGVKIPDNIERAVGTVSNQLLKVKAFGESFKPALESMLQVAKLQSVTGQLDVGTLMPILGQAYDVQNAQIKLEKKIRQQTMVSIAGGMGSGLADFIGERLTR